MKTHPRGCSGIPQVGDHFPTVCMNEVLGLRCCTSVASSPLMVILPGRREEVYGGWVGRGYCAY
jgi:hypothetical protein